MWIDGIFTHLNKSYIEETQAMKWDFLSDNIINLTTNQDSHHHHNHTEPKKKKKQKYSKICSWVIEKTNTDNTKKERKKKPKSITAIVWLTGEIYRKKKKTKDKK